VLGWLGRETEELAVYDDILSRYRGASDERLAQIVQAAEELQVRTEFEQA